MGRKERDGDPYRPDAPGWYPDPWSATGSGERYFDGKQWGTSERPRARESNVVVPLRPPGSRGKRTGGLKALIARFRIPIVLVLIGAAAVGLYVLQESKRAGGPGEVAFDQGIGVTRPPPGAEEAPTRLSPVPTATAGPGRHEFQRMQAGSETAPVAWDPCRPIHWVYNPANAPTSGLAIA